MRCSLSTLGLALAATAVADAQVFVDSTAGSGLSTIPLDRPGFGTGMCASDFDGDGDLDLVIPTAFGQPIRFFANRGNMVFVDKTSNAGLGASRGGRACQAGDIDNDGDSDLLIGGQWASPALFINDGTGKFTEESALRGLIRPCSAWSASFGDYDRDGWLDLYIGNRYGSPGGSPEPSILYRNTGGGHFVETTTAAGVAHANGATFVAAFFDYDEDGWPDIYCVNDKGYLWSPNELFHNNRDGTFSPRAAQLGVDDAIDGMGLDFVDAFNDGGMDFFCSDSPPDHVFHVWDPAQGQYTSQATTFGLQGNLVGWSSRFADFDNDGWQDLYVVHTNTPNHLYVNPARAHSESIPWPERAGPLTPSEQQTTCIVADLDGDGRVDLLHRFASGPTGVSLHRNVTPARNWLGIRLHGTVSNSDGIGARVEVRAGGVNQRQFVRNGVGFMSGHAPHCHFGLGAASNADVHVIWPSGQEQLLRNVVSNATLSITEPHFRIRGLPRIGASASLELHSPDDRGLSYAMMLAVHDQPRTALPDGRLLPLAVDGLSYATLVPNALLTGSIGTLTTDQASASLNLPLWPPLIGLRLYATCFTFRPVGSYRTIFPRPVTIDIQ